MLFGFNVGSFGTGFAMGFGSGFFAREALPIARDILAPISRVTLRTIIMGFEKSKEGLARFGETVDDVFAEVRQDLRRPKAKKAQQKKSKKKTQPLAQVTRIA